MKCRFHSEFKHVRCGRNVPTRSLVLFDHKRTCRTSCRKAKHVLSKAYSREPVYPSLFVSAQRSEYSSCDFLIPSAFLEEYFLLFHENSCEVP